MTMVIALTALAALALLILLPPLVSAPAPATAGREAYDLSVYRDQLAELQRDVGRGILTQAEVASAHIEIERRMLKALPARAATAPHAMRHPRLLAAVLALAVPLAAGGIYVKLGVPGLPDQPLAGRSSLATTSTGPGAHQYEQMIAKLAVKLAKDPNDAEGWLMLGRSYDFLHRYDKAAEALRRAAELKPEPAILGTYGEALVRASRGLVGLPARAAFEASLKLDPADPRARFYLALAREQAGDNRGALDSFVDLAKISPANAPWLPAVHARIVVNATKLGLDPASQIPKSAAATGTRAMRSEPRGGGYVPLPAGSKAFLALSPAERDAFVRQRVADLAKRLEHEPQNVEGWQQLARSYKVLGETAKAQDAIAHALRVAAGTPTLAEVKATARALDLDPSGAASANPISPAAKPDSAPVQPR